jgi:copper chaperone
MSEAEQVYRVVGMTCEHCVAAVRAEVAGLPGVEEVEVELAGGGMAVRGNASEQAVRSAVEEAGYSLDASSMQRFS